MLFLKKIKRTLTWKYIVLIIIKPFFDFIWSYIINLEAKILYFKWNKQKRDFFDLKGSNHLIVKNDNRILKIVDELNNFCTDEVLKKSKQKLTSEGAYGKLPKDSYQNELFDLLPENLKDKVVKFATSDLIVNTAAQYLGVFPILSRIYFYHNIPKTRETIMAQRWHKDGMSYKGIDFFIPITDVDHENGPLFFVKRKSKLGAFEKIDKIDQNSVPGGRGKVSDEEFSKIFKDHEINTLLGEKGTTLIVDSYNCYHKGGHCKSKERVMLRIAFDTIDSTVIYFDEDRYKSDKIFYFNKEKVENIDNNFLKYLMFRRSKIIKKLKIAPALLKIYEIFQYKMN
tara:strand:+ start:1359 stop:2381 length:1023 start_codon:yes stop_codon:yes gene_type:complete